MRTFSGTFGVYPAGLLSTGLLLAALLVAAPTRAQQTDVHTVESGQTLYSIAQTYGTTVDRLRELNDLEGSRIEIGLRLRVPARTSPSPEGTHRIQTGETLYAIAARYDVEVDSLLEANPDLELAGPLPVDSLLSLPRTFRPIAYEVRSGNTLIGIARKFGVSVERLRAENGIEGSSLQVGQHLRIPARSIPDPGPPGSLGSVDESGPMRVFPAAYTGRLMASGSPYRPDRLLISHPDLPFGAVVLLTNPETGRSTFARVRDRGPVEEGVMVDVSDEVADVLGAGGSDEETIELRIVDR